MPVQAEKVSRGAVVARKPAYLRIEHDLRSRVVRGEWKPGVMLPGRRDLAREYGVDLMTLQRAIEKLLDDETLVASGRRGTFVKESFLVAPDDGRPTPRPSKTLRIGVVGTSVDDYSKIVPRTFFLNYTFLAAFESTLQTQRDVDFLFFQVGDGSGSPDMTMAHALLDTEKQALDGVVFVFADTPGDIDAISRHFMRASVPMVVTSSRRVDTPIPLVYYDNFAAGYEATWRLIERGAKQITVVSPFDEHWAHERVNGSRKAVEHAGLPADAFTIWPEDGWYPIWDQDQLTAGKSAGAKLFSERPDTEAVMAINDFVAMGLVAAARKLGRFAGKHYLLISFDDLPQAATAGISSMRLPLDAMGREAARLLMQAIDGDRDVSQLRLKSQLVTRASLETNGR